MDIFAEMYLLNLGPHILSQIKKIPVPKNVHQIIQIVH